MNDSSVRLVMHITVHDGLVCTYKAVSSGFTGLPVGYHHRLVDLPKGLEVFSQRGIVCVVWQAAHEDFGISSVFLERCGMHDVQRSVHELMQKHWFSRGEQRRLTGLFAQRSTTSQHE